MQVDALARTDSSQAPGLQEAHARGGAAGLWLLAVEGMAVRVVNTVSPVMPGMAAAEEAMATACAPLTCPRAMGASRRVPVSVWCPACFLG